jgi:flagellar biosynthesis protein FliQ
MTGDLPYALMRDGFVMIATVGAPYMLGLLAVGVVVGLLQAATQVNDPAVGFLPRVIAAVLICWLVGHWSIERLARYVFIAFQKMAERG